MGGGGKGGGGGGGGGQSGCQWSEQIGPVGGSGMKGMGRARQTNLTLHDTPEFCHGRFRCVVVVRHGGIAGRAAGQHGRVDGVVRSKLEAERVAIVPEATHC